MERIVKEDIEKHLETNGLIGNSQHGFRHGRSPQTNLVEFMDQTTKWIDNGRSFDIIYMDFAKAFDKVCHASLAAKLKAKGVEGKVLGWIKNWLFGRQQRVVVEGEWSELEEVLSSVLQGSVLGGTFFGVFIEDLDELILAFLRKFADDTKMAMIVENEEQARALQKDIDTLYAWATKWRMEFNVAKCKVIHVGRKNLKWQYEMGGERLSVGEEEKDLGVWTHQSLKPATQCERAAKSGNMAMGMILRAFHYRTRETLIPLYKTFVRPRLEFAVAAWSPWTAKDEGVLEDVQKRLIRSLSDCRGGTYEEKLQEADLTTLRERRRRGDMMEVFKTLRGMNKVNKGEWFDIRTGEEARSTRTNTVVEEGGTTRKTETLYKPPANGEIRDNFFTVRVVRRWNDLPEVVKEKSSLNGFKNAYDKWMKEKQTIE